MIDARPVALVTGGNRGIGREVASQLFNSGFTVILGSRNRELGEQAPPTLTRPVTRCWRVSST